MKLEFSISMFYKSSVAMFCSFRLSISCRSVLDRCITKTMTDCDDTNSNMSLTYAHSDFEIIIDYLVPSLNREQ